MKGPICDKCEGTEFTTVSIDRSRAVVVHCVNCGHIVGAYPEPAFAAQMMVAALTKGLHDGLNKPVVRVKQVDTAFG